MSVLEKVIVRAPIVPAAAAATAAVAALGVLASSGVPARQAAVVVPEGPGVEETASMVRAVTGTPVGAGATAAIGTPSVLEASSGVQALTSAGAPEAIPEALTAAPTAVAVATTRSAPQIALLLPTRLAATTVGGQIQASASGMGGPVPAITPRRAPDAMGVAVGLASGLRRATPSRKVATPKGATATPRRVTTRPIMVGLVVGPVLVAAETPASEAVQTATEARVPIAKAGATIGAVLATTRSVIEGRQP